MPKLILKFEDRTLNECAVGLMATIGRLPDNTVVIDNPAVSGHHACIFRDGDQFVVEDLDSKNGTFVNDTYVTSRRVLQNGDILSVGKHTLVFDRTGSTDAIALDEAELMISRLGDTVYLETQKQRALLAKLRDELRIARAQTNTVAGAPSPATPGTGSSVAKVGVLRVLAGHADQSEYRLEARTSLVGKSDSALVRLRGWFKPQVAVAIARNGDGYVATGLGGRTHVNGQRLSGRYDLKDGDILRVTGLTLEFRLKVAR